MRGKVVMGLISLWAILAPIQMSIICLMSIIFVDTIVKLFALKVEAKNTDRKYREVFKSKMLRRGYIIKTGGYVLTSIPLFPLDFYFLTPFLNGILHFLGYEVDIPTPAIFTNLLLVIFCLIELSSINENWFDISGNNIFSGVLKAVKKIRAGITSVSDLYKDVKK
jgi:hypothetical protein